MYLIVGLGNPDRKFENTKHNMGFDAVTELTDRYRIPSSGISMKGMYGKGIIKGQKVILLKPLTYMNLSGDAVSAYVHYYKIDPEKELIVIYDDTDLSIGQIRVRKSGKSGTHNGMKDVVAKLGTEKFTRIRVGIGSRPSYMDLVDYVMSPFSKEERVLVDEALKKAADAAEMILSDGVEAAMNTFNKKEKKNESDETGTA